MRHSPLRIWAGADEDAIEVYGIAGDHAGRCETSQLWALQPELVDMSRQLGEAIVASQVAWLGRKASELLQAWQPPDRPASRTPGNPLGALTFGEAERIWREEVEPLLPTFSSMNDEPDQAPKDPASPWSDNQQSHEPYF